MNPNILLLAVCILFAGCGFGNNDQEQPEPERVTTTETQAHGTVLSDENGNVLYFFTRDVAGESNCTGECLQNWPAFTAEAVSSQADLDPNNFANMQRADGGTQTTYKGWPLYFFSNDNAPGEVNGDGINNVWFVAKPDYTLMIADGQLVGNDGNNYRSDYTEGEEITTYFTDSEGRTLYAFSNDEYNTNNYTNEDFSNNDAWPIYYEEIDALPSGINENDIEVIDVHGEQQLTYKGWPLYYFGQDQNSGETKGVSVPQPGVWPIVNNEIPEAPQPEPTVVQTTNTQAHGEVLSDGDGNVLYFFTRDVAGESNCSGECLQNWPAFAADEISSELDPANFTNIERADGSNQTSYKGWPLYYFSNDNAPGDVNGDGINNVWFVASNNYTLMIADGQLVGNDGNNYQSDYTEGEEITTYFTDSEGRTLYAFSNDEYNTNNYTNEDFSNNDAWPIYYEEIDALPSGINENDIEVIDVHGEQQLTYKGWPLYYFGQDQNPGETKGVSVPQPGVWPIVNNDTEQAPQPSS